MAIVELVDKEKVDSLLTVEVKYIDGTETTFNNIEAYGISTESDDYLYLYEVGYDELPTHIINLPSTKHMSLIMKDNPQFNTILKEELRKQLPEYPSTVSNELLIKDIIEIVNYSMTEWRKLDIEE